MKQVKRVLSTYTADVSGACSALFELGGMVIMHDASGCNSTYNTHDEPRWYDSKSLIFISGLSELEAVMGDDEKLIADIVQASDEFSPKFIAIASTPIPMMMGTDILAIARRIEAQTKIPTFGLNTTGMNSYIYGASLAFTEYAKRMVKHDVKKIPKSVNILGATPLDFQDDEILDIKKRLLNAGFNIASVWAMGDMPQVLENAGGALANIVISSTGLGVAQFFKEKFNIPYVVGVPKNDLLLEKMLKGLENKNAFPFSEYLPKKDAKIVVIGEGVIAKSLAYEIYTKYNKEVRVLCPLEVSKELMSENDILVSEEEDIRETLSKVDIVIADPCYRAVASSNCKFYDLPHRAFSGRMYFGI